MGPSPAGPVGGARAWATKRVKSLIQILARGRNPWDRYPWAPASDVLAPGSSAAVTCEAGTRQGAREGQLERYGDETQGFEVDSSGEAVVVRAWGFWSTELAEQVVPVVASALRAKGSGTDLTIDATDLRPLRNEAQRSFEAMLSQAVQNSARGVVIQSPSALTRLQMIRLVRGIGNPERIQVR